MSMDGKSAIFRNSAGLPAVAVRFEDDNVWLTQQNLADLYHTTKQNIGQHLKTIFAEGELSETATVKKFFTMGKKPGQVAERPIYHYKRSPKRSFASIARASFASSNPTLTVR